MAGAPVHRPGVGDELDGEDAREAVRRHLERGEAPPQAGPPHTWQVTRQTLVTGRIVRSIESRTEKPRRKPGDFDLSGGPFYDVLGGYRLAPPRDPSEPMTLLLVKRGSEAVEPCPPPCDGGSVECPKCSGRKTVHCEPRTDCPTCGGKDSCLNCGEGSGDPDVPDAPGAAASEAARPVPVRTEKRLRCAECGQRGVACRSCLGRGDLPCAVCGETGLRDCPACDRAGTVRHDDCEGRGSFTTWVQGKISRQPTTKPFRWPTRGVSALVRNIARRNGSWRTAVLDGRTGLASVAELDDEAVKGLEPRLATAEGEVARKATLEALPLFRVDVPLLPYRVHYAHPAPAAHPTGTAHGVFTVPSRQRTLQIAVAALGALALLTLLWWLVAG